MIHSCIDHLYSGETPCPRCEEARKGLTPITIEPSDLRVDIYRTKPHSAWTWIEDTGVRITHVPTGLSASCHEGRSVHRNRALAMEKLSKMPQTHEPVKVPSDEELLKWGAEEEFFLFCDEDEFLQIARGLLARYGSKS